MSRPTYITINLDALRHNLACVGALAPGRRILAMLKANAYGHGMTRVARALSEADAFGVASLEEGMALRESGVARPIVLVEGVFSSDELALAVKYQCELVVHHLFQLEMLEKARLQSKVPIWLKINTGMNRLGTPLSEVPQVYQRLMAAAQVKKPICLMTHFAEADRIASNVTRSQIAMFYQAVENLIGPRSLANSAAIMAWPEALGGTGDWVRPGLMLYGASPFVGKTGEGLGLRPVMTLCSRIIAINTVAKGERVGYGGTWTAPADRRVAVVAAGYGDGYPQFAKNNTPVLVNDSVCPLVGRVSMDMLTVDVTQQPQAKIGDPVTLWGEGLPVEHVAAESTSSPYEVFTRMTVRPRVEEIENEAPSQVIAAGREEGLKAQETLCK